MQAETLAVAAEQPERLHLRVAWLCGVVLFLEGYDIAAVGYAIPSLVDAWRAPSAFTQVLTAGNIGLQLGSLGVGLLGDQLRRKDLGNAQRFSSRTSERSGRANRAGTSAALHTHFHASTWAGRIRTPSE